MRRICSLLFSVALSAGAQTYTVTKLISDVSGLANKTDANLVNPWGLVSSQGSPWWVANNGTGTSTVYDSQGNIVPLIVQIPPSSSSTSAKGTPTGIVGNATTDFAGAGFLFASEDGVISAWTGAASAVKEIDNGTAAVYKGLAIGKIGTRNVLYAANFRAARVEVYDGAFHAVTLASGAFTDPQLPAGYAPFGIQAIGSLVVVTFAKQDAAKHDEVDGPGNGYVDVFDGAGALKLRLQHGNYLNAPWGVAVAGANFGAFSNDLIVGNFGSGLLVAFDGATGKVEGVLRNTSSQLLVIPGLWAIQFGQGGSSGPSNWLYFTAGIARESHGLFGFLAPY